MSAQPVHEDPDPRDPQTILAILPEREHDVFLARYRELAHAAADDITAYRQLEKYLRAWSVRARIVSRPGYYEELEAEREAIVNGTAHTVPIEEVISQVKGIPLDEATEFWECKVKEARLARQNRG